METKSIDVFMTTEKQLVDEEEVVWLEDINKLDYVREHLVECVWKRRGSWKYDMPGRQVGYANLRSDAKGDMPGCFKRRRFWLKEYDRDSTDFYRVGAPAEAVDPRTVVPGVPGKMTERAWGAPFKTES